MKSRLMGYISEAFLLPTGTPSRKGRSIRLFSDERPRTGTMADVVINDNVRHAKIISTMCGSVSPSQLAYGGEEYQIVLPVATEAMFDPPADKRYLTVLSSGEDVFRRLSDVKYSKGFMLRAILGGEPRAATVLRCREAGPDDQKLEPLVPVNPLPSSPLPKSFPVRPAVAPGVVGNYTPTDPELDLGWKKISLWTNGDGESVPVMFPVELAVRNEDLKFPVEIVKANIVRLV